MADPVGRLVKLGFLGGLLVACADPGTTPPADVPPFGTTTVSISATTSQAGELTVRGTVQEGVEAGCLLLSQDGRQYLLLGGDRQVLRPGSEVVVRGRPQPDLSTTCQQGLPFTVTDARPA